MRGLVFSLMLAAAGTCSGGLFAQPSDLGMIQSNVLVVDIDRMFSESAYGRQLNDEIEQASAEIVAQNRRIETELTAEELTLTGQRSSLPREDFRKLAEEFDEKVQRLRAEQDAKAESLRNRGDENRREFLQAARPVLETLMRASNALVIIERRDVVITADAVDVTDRAIALIDARAEDDDIGGGVTPEAATSDDAEDAPTPDDEVTTPEDTPDAPTPEAATDQP
ncbi:Skp family chaperone for outer membrane proteins [Sagittula marina]|uniref:Skp family chaperone for outer membrane proteins n=1 Tax=Sagittula marina TaxID=943940 RepID=A0A7W6DL92_9RHOB|nr:OmpH family outer membrane protein [Sagittula marina]MBB3985043.1 Skp family chaperone for outer membrane proteins [Sagittula marina]